MTGWASWVAVVMVCAAPATAFAGTAPGEADGPKIQRPKAAPSIEAAAPVVEAPVAAPAVTVSAEPEPAPEPPPTVEPIEAPPEAEVVVATMEPALPEPEPAARLDPRSPGSHDRGEVGKPKHKGVIFDVGVGAMGCTRSVCSGSGHQAQPGVRVGGFAGYNIKGRVELGLLGGWGRMNTGVEANSGVLEMYGVPSQQTPLVAEALGLTWNDLRTDGAVLSAANLAPVVRVHFPREGKFGAYVGAGAGWARFRAAYTGMGGRDDYKLTFTGLDVPAHIGAMYYVNRYVAVGGMVEYRWTHWVALRVDHPRSDLIAPLRVIENQATANGLEFSPQLPHMWMVSLGVRLTI